MTRKWQMSVACVLMLGIVAVLVTQVVLKKKQQFKPGTTAMKEESIPDRMLTTDETIGLIFHGGGERIAPFHLFRRADPAAKPDMYRLLEDESPGLYSFHGNVFKMLAYIGDDMDIDQFLRILSGYSGVLTGTQTRKVTAILVSLGIMARRGNQKAAALLDEMTSPSYWSGKFKWRPDEFVTPNHLTAELESVYRVIIAQTIAEREGLDEIRRKILEGINDSQRRTFMAELIAPLNCQEQAKLILEAEQQIPTAEDYQTLQFLFEHREERLSSFRASDKE